MNITQNLKTKIQNHIPKSKVFLKILNFGLLLWMLIFPASVIEAKNNEDLYEFMAESAEAYYKQHDYNGCIAYLSSLSEQRKDIVSAVDYFTALTRWNQLKYWEDSQNWNEYFDAVNFYRAEIESRLKDAINKTGADNPFNIYARLLLWKFYGSQGSGLSDKVLAGLKDSAAEYARNTANIILIKDVADALSSSGEKPGSKELYKIYVDKLVSANKEIKMLESAARDFYNQGNLELSEAVYDIFIERSLQPAVKEELIPVLVDIAKQFSCAGSGPRDAVYAEKIFAKTEQVWGNKIFDEPLLYLRAVNSEQIGDYRRAKDIYLDLLGRFPESRYSREAEYKIGVIYVYVLSEMDRGAAYLEKSAQGAAVDWEAVSGLYQLGLLKQWSGDFIKAKEYYNRLIQLNAGKFSEKTVLAAERLKEIDEDAQIEYNLKTFLDAALKEENAVSAQETFFELSSRYGSRSGSADSTSFETGSVFYGAQTGQDVSVVSDIAVPETGCIQMDLEYLWSGDLGSAAVKTKSPVLDTKYCDKGVKLICLVIVSPSGVLGRAIELLNVN